MLIARIPVKSKRRSTRKKEGKKQSNREKGYRNKPLSEKQKASNKEKSRTRARVKHLFGFVENSMNG